MRKTIAIIMVSTFFGGLFGSYLTINHFDQFKNLNAPAEINEQVLGYKENNTSADDFVDEQEKENLIVSAVNKVSPSVVSISIEQDVSKNIQVDPFEDFFNGWPFYQVPRQQPKTQEPNWQKVGGGTGFIISSDGYILTNKHVVSDEEAKYSVILNDGTEYKAKLVGTDLFNDIGALKIEADNLPIVELGNSDDLVIGQSVVAIGNALAEFSNTVTTGVVSGIGRSIVASDGSGSSEKLEDVIQTDAAINPGNSGGPLLNLSGQVIGINTAISREGQLIGFAIPINSAKSIIEGIKTSGEIVRPYLGVRYMILTPEIAKENNLEIESGALIVRGEDRTQLAIVPGSPADKAGLLENDIILEVNDTKIDQENNLAKVIARYSPGDEVTLKVWSKGENKELKVKLEKYK